MARVAVTLLAIEATLRTRAFVAETRLRVLEHLTEIVIHWRTVLCVVNWAGCPRYSDIQSAAYALIMKKELKIGIRFRDSVKPSLGWAPSRTKANAGSPIDFLHSLFDRSLHRLCRILNLAILHEIKKPRSILSWLPDGRTVQRVQRGG